MWGQGSLLPQAHPPDEEGHSGGRKHLPHLFPHGGQDSWKRRSSRCIDWKPTRGSLWLQCKEVAVCLGGEPHPHRLGV